MKKGVLTPTMQSLLTQKHRERVRHGHISEVHAHERIVMPWGDEEERILRNLNHVTTACSIADAMVKMTGRLSPTARLALERAAALLEDTLAAYPPRVGRPPKEVR